MAEEHAVKHGVTYRVTRLEDRALGSISGSCALVFLIGVSVLLLAAAIWAAGVFNVGFDAVIATLGGPLEGTGGGMIGQALSACIPPALICTAIATVVALLLRHRAKALINQDASDLRDSRLQLVVLARRAIIACSVGLLLTAVFCAVNSFGVDNWLVSRFGKTLIYEENYVHPDEVAISAENPKNLIYIYVESLESAYASKEDGGLQTENYMPKLTQLAEDNISFSDNDKLGGFYATKGSTWTMAALLSTTSGVPYAFGDDGTLSRASDGEFATGLLALGDILEDAGYAQEFMCGSDIAFGGRGKYLSSHGDYDIYDYNTAIEREDIPAGYYEGWGFEDKKLFELAKDELQRIASGDQPFNFTMLTVDLHTPDGNLCEICPDAYEGVTANVVACSDNQVSEFVEWIKQQPFAEDTVIVITGDHPRMDTSLVGNVDVLERPVYNCFINADAPDDFDASMRTITSQDIFPTVLASLGFSIEGNRLGLGTNAFSDEPTLAEKMGLDALNNEFSMQSDWYVPNLAPEMRSSS